MRYLFFDTESSNCYGGVCKLCEFGYQLFDDNFNLLKEGSWALSPGEPKKNRFDLKIYERDPEFKYSHSYEYYFQQPEFPKFYQKIKSLMCNHNTLCFAYAYHNDIIALQWACKRYKLKYLDFKCFDVQKIYQINMALKNPEKLAHVFLKLFGENDLNQITAHMPQDDAKMAAMIFQETCFLKKKAPWKILQEQKDFEVNSREYFLNWYQKQDERLNRANCTRFYKEACDKYKDLINLEGYIGKRYKIAKPIDYNYKDLKQLLMYLESLSGIIVSKLDDADYCVVINHNDINLLKENLIEYSHLKFIVKSDLDYKINGKLEGRSQIVKKQKQILKLDSKY
ncbi:hypothetical protein [[Mycoplasma] testudinis]|uniref:hypothetical protein n=1 Tax=[Mycoplasma] testudinis TaxID=33924 RepID=UPI00048999DB|nr:hypothetical protein [[Mycoplasma] testudinis]